MGALSKRYLSLTCPICIFKIAKSCSRQFSGDCCIWGMKKDHIFTNVEEASAFCLNCYHFSYERSYLDFCIEGNIFENALRHGIRYFNLINHGDDFTSQRFGVLNLNTRYVAEAIRNSIHDTHNADFSMMNVICKSFSNGTRCANCEMQSIEDHGVNYVKIRPKTNEDYHRSQILR